MHLWPFLRVMRWQKPQTVNWLFRNSGDKFFYLISLSLHCLPPIQLSYLSSSVVFSSGQQWIKWCLLHCNPMTWDRVHPTRELWCIAKPGHIQPLHSVEYVYFNYKMYITLPPLPTPRVPAFNSNTNRNIWFVTCTLEALGKKKKISHVVRLEELLMLSSVCHNNPFVLCRFSVCWINMRAVDGLFCSSFWCIFGSFLFRWMRRWVCKRRFMWHTYIQTNLCSANGIYNNEYYFKRIMLMQ